MARTRLPRREDFSRTHRAAVVLIRCRPYTPPLYWLVALVYSHCLECLVRLRILPSDSSNLIATRASEPEICCGEEEGVFMSEYTCDTSAAVLCTHTSSSSCEISGDNGAAREEAP